MVKSKRLPHKLPIPRSTQQAFRVRGAKCQNVGLIFDRYLHFTDRDCDWDMGKYPTGTRQQDTAKNWNLREISKINLAWKTSSHGNAVRRWIQTVKSQHADPFPMTPEWRFAVGLGEKNALENGLTFHRIYGFPIIPGSALKGLARAYALWEIAELLEAPRLSLSQIKELGDNKTPLQKLDEWLLLSNEDMAKQNKFELDKTKQDMVNAFRRIFGTKHAAGEAIFFDAVPAESPKLEVDVMNVHYPDYYGERSTEPPADNQNPNPIPFLTVGRTPFWFAVGWRGQLDTTLYEQAKTWLRYGLTEFGIGSKTAAGYGYFEEII